MFAAILGYLDRQAIVAVSPTIKQEFQLTDEQWGWVNSVFSFVYLISSVIGGLWIDRIGIRLGLALSVALWTWAAAGHALVAGYWGLCFWRVMLAGFEGPGYASLLKGSRRLMPPQWRDTAVGLILAGTTVGALITPILVVPLAERYGWQSAFLVTAGLSVLWLPCWALLAWRPQANLGPDPTSMPIGTDVAPQRLAWRSYGVWAAVLSIFFATPPTMFTYHFLGLYLSKSYGLTQTEIGWLMWQPFLAAELGQVAGGMSVFFLVRAGWGFLRARRLIIVVGLLGSLVLLLANATTDAQTALWWLNLSRFFFMAGYTVLATYGIETVSEKQTALMNGILNATFSASNFVFSPLLGRMADNYGYAPAIELVALTPLLSLGSWLLFSWLHARQSGRLAGSK